MKEKSKTPNFDKLDPKDKDMVDYYCNVKRTYFAAYQHAWYPGGLPETMTKAVARKNASDMFAKPHIRVALNEKFREIWEKRDNYNGQLVELLASIAFGDPSNLMESSGKGKIEFKDWEGEDLRVIQSFKAGHGNGKKDEKASELIEIKLHDRIKAASLLAELNGLKHVKIEDVTDISKQKERMKELVDEFRKENGGGE